MLQLKYLFSFGFDLTLLFAFLVYATYYPCVCVCVIVKETFNISLDCAHCAFPGGKFVKIKVV